MREFAEYIKNYVNGFLCVVGVYMIQILLAKTEKPKKRKVGSKRSFIRRISKWIPIFPRKKIYIKVNTSTSSSNTLDSCINSQRPSQKNEVLDGLNIISTLFDTTLDSGVCWRSSLSIAQDTSSHITSCEDKTRSQESNEHSFLSESFDVTLIVPDSQASASPDIIDNTTTSSSAICAMAKISQLEEELALLRQQISSIAATQEVVNSQNCESLSKVFLPPPMMPPPPPPPPPPLPLTVGSLMTLKDDAQKNKSKKSNYANNAEKLEACSQKSDKTTVVPHMLDVLKGINAVKLRPIERSPGGTPIRRPTLPSSSQDPASLLAAALQRRFAGIHPEGNEKENRQSFGSPSFKENEDSSFSIQSKPIRL